MGHFYDSRFTVILDGKKNYIQPNDVYFHQIHPLEIREQALSLPIHLVKPVPLPKIKMACHHRNSLRSNHVCFAVGMTCNSIDVAISY